MCGAYLEQRRGVALVCPCWVHVHPFFQALHVFYKPCTGASRWSVLDHPNGTDWCFSAP